ncbi:hypothetical protein SERLA73DRAFT_185340 [Serpula lacrymans var. lacrymans S7.3]|uniref:Uncharacterized protein n=1 Tax=Serpula lacrymans var. lacrymans (strain S7.3) TaxID=936435 RepID=F8Q4K7_SERL3|nr:hypothetical protein SERLA73DRAFT_185340 [Serpula lacrymans var. lacrymans S7.3]
MVLQFAEYERRLQNSSIPNTSVMIPQRPLVSQIKMAGPLSWRGGRERLTKRTGFRDQIIKNTDGCQ